MQNFKVEQQSIGSLITNYPHDPESQPQSIEDYMEDMLTAGFAVHSMSFRGTSDIVTVFRVVAK